MSTTNIIKLALATLLAAQGTAAADSYSLPWDLVSTSAGNALRVDSAVAVFNDQQGNVDFTGSTQLDARYQLTSSWMPMLRLAVVGNNAPGAALDGSTLANPLLGATHVRNLGRYHIALTHGVTLPIGTGGGDNPDPRTERANLASQTARPVDGAMFDVNYMTGILTADAAYVSGGFTAQGEVTLQHGFRVRGDGDGGRASAAAGIHVGQFLGSHVSVGADLRHQRWLSKPSMMTESKLALTTVTVGARVHFRAGGAGFAPGISLTRGLDGGVDAPLVTEDAMSVQLDVPMTF